MEKDQETFPRIISWLIEQKDRLFYGFLIVALLLVGSYRLSFSKVQKRQSAFAKAELAHQQVLSGKMEAVADLQQAMSKQRQLQQRYDASLAQSLLDRQDLEAAMPCAQRLLKRTAARGGAYNSFAQTTLLISEGRLEEALKEAQVLEERELPQLLWAYNLMRIALLKDELGQSGKESWSKLVAWLDDHSAEAEEFSKSFQSGEVSVRDFAKARIAANR